MEMNKKKAKLSDFKSPYSTVDEIGLDYSKLHGKEKRKLNVDSHSAFKPKTRRVEENSHENSTSSHFNIEPSSSGVQTSVYQSKADAFETYKSGVLGIPGYMVVTSKKDIFVVLDFDSDKKILQKRPQIVMRTSHGFSCTCNDIRRNYLDNMSGDIKEDIDEMFPPCFHIMIIKHVYYNILMGTEVDEDILDIDHVYSKSRMEESDLNMSDICEIPFLDDHYVVDCNSNISVVKILFGQMTCCFCKSKDCIHTNHVDNLLRKYEDLELPEIVDSIVGKLEKYQKRNPSILKCLSTKKTPFILTRAMTDKIKTPFIQNSCLVDESYQLFDHQQRCVECGSGLPEEFIKEPVSKLLTRYDCLDVQTFSRKCTEPSCGKTSYYDGSSDCILNMGIYLVHYEVLRDFMFQYLLSGCTMFRFYKVWENHQRDGGNQEFSKLFPYNFFRQSWYSYMGLLDIDFKADFICNHPSCGTSPKMLVMDGTSLGFQKQFLSHENISDENNAERLHGSKHQDRIFIRHMPLRDIVYRFSKQKAKFTTEEFHQMKKLASQHAPALNDFFDYLQKTGCTHECPEEYADLIRMIACNSPVCAAFPLQYLNMVEDVLKDSNSSKMEI